MAGKFRIVGARPKGSVGQLNTEFKMYEHKKVDEKWRWAPIG